MRLATPFGPQVTESGNPPLSSTGNVNIPVNNGPRCHYSILLADGSADNAYSRIFRLLAALLAAPAFWRSLKPIKLLAPICQYAMSPFAKIAIQKMLPPEEGQRGIASHLHSVAGLP